MTAPLHFSSGAPVAQIKCATAEIAYSKKSAAQARATGLALWRKPAALPTFSNIGDSPASAVAAVQHIQSEIPIWGSPYRRVVTPFRQEGTA